MSDKKKINKKVIFSGIAAIIVVILVVVFMSIEDEEREIGVNIKNDSSSVYRNYTGDTIEVDGDVKKQVESKITEKREDSVKNRSTNIEHIPVDAKYIEISNDLDLKDLFKDEFIPCVTSEYDENGFNCKTGFNREGFNKDGIDVNGYNTDGCNEYGLDILGNKCGEQEQPPIDECIDGVDSNGKLCGIYEKKYDENGCDEDGLNIDGDPCKIDEPVVEEEPVKIKPICLSEDDCLENSRYRISFNDEERVWYENRLKNKMNKINEMIEAKDPTKLRTKAKESFATYVEPEAPVDTSTDVKDPDDGGVNQVVNNDIQIPVGGMINARLKADINSDYPGMVRAVVVGGPYHGAELFGTFNVPFIDSTYMPRDKISINFNSLVFKRENYAISAAGLDSASLTDFIGGSVNNHYALRWGGLVASSLVKGIGDSVTMGRESTANTGGNLIATNPITKTSDQLKVGLGEVAGELTQIARDQFSRPPTVTINKNSASGSLFPVVFLTEVVDDRLPMLFSRSEQVDINRRMMNNYNPNK